MKSKVGDPVECFYDDNGDGSEYVGRTGRITDTDGSARYPYRVSFADWATFGDHELRKIKKEQQMSKKYYRVLKDTPLWSESAIIVQEQENGQWFSAIEDYWDTEGSEAMRKDGDTPYMDSRIVENNPDFYERVYEMTTLGKMVFVTKEEAKKQAAKFFKKA